MSVDIARKEVCAQNGQDINDSIVLTNDAPDKEDENSVDGVDDSPYQITKKQRLSLKLNDETIEAIKDVFRLLDKDGNCKLDKSELANAMKSMGVELEDKEIEELMTQVDEDGNGTLDIFEFSQIVSSKMSEYDPVKELNEAFAVFDTNEDGRISIDELRAVVDSLGGSMTEEELENMLLEADDNGDGGLDYTEFVRIWMGDEALVSDTKVDGEDNADVEATN